MIIIENISPELNSYNNPKNSLIVFDIVDSSNSLNLSLLDVNVEGVDAYSGISGFVSPFNGSFSSVEFLSGGSSWGYDAYRIIIEKTSDLSNSVSVNVMYSTLVNETWEFLTKIPIPYISTLNCIYFSDSYGVKKVDIIDLGGESQSVVQTVLSTSTNPPILDNSIDSMYVEVVDGYFYLTFSLKNEVLTGLNWGDLDWDEAWSEDYFYKGCFVVKNELEINQFSDGYKVFSPRINNRGILYLINEDQNTIEVYYGAHLYSGTDRKPDFIYSSSSIPAIFPGEITCLYIANDASSELANGTRLYIGTSLGATMVDACDVENPDGYCAGFDYLGKSTTYSVVGGGADFEIIGGTSPRVAAIASNEEKMITFIATDGYYGEAGLSQISSIRNRRIVFMTSGNNLIPSNNIRDIFTKVV